MTKKGANARPPARRPPSLTLARSALVYPPVVTADWEQNPWTSHSQVTLPEARSQKTVYSLFLSAVPPTSFISLCPPHPAPDLYEHNLCTYFTVLPQLPGTLFYVNLFPGLHALSHRINPESAPFLFRHI